MMLRNSALAEIKWELGLISFCPGLYLWEPKSEGL